MPKMLRARLRASVGAGLIGALAVGQPTVALAGADDVIGGVIGGVIAGGIMNHAAKQREQSRTVTRRSAPVYSAQREQTRQVQTALNYFGFPAGPEDGIMGSQTRAAVSNYQAYMGFAPTGQLTEFERGFLVQSHSRAQAGGFATQQKVATLPDGTRGLLRVYRDQQIQAASMSPDLSYPGAQPQAQAAQPAPPAAAGNTTVVVNTSPEAPAAGTQQAAAQQAQPAAPAPGDPAAALVPNFMAEEAEASVTSYCNMVNLRTSSSGGFVTQASMTDPQVALDEQFCLARTYAIARGEELIERVKGVTPAQIEAQCASFGPLLEDQVAALSFKSPDQVMADVGEFVLASGVAPNQLKGTAEICLAVGYRTDDLDVTLGSALLLTVLGERPYAELMGHHLVEGFGASRRTDLALAWYEVGLAALENGAAPVFASASQTRTPLLKASVGALASANGAALETDTAPTQAAQQDGGLPTFSIAQ